MPAIDIVIKSFNRPYYLERCLRSIYQFTTGDFRVRVLDDGTPPEYLAHIKALFPEVAIHTSPAYDAKVAAIRHHVSGQRTFDQRNIPTQFWLDHITECSSIFLLLEDDIWLTGPLLLDELKQDMEANGLDMVKISWLGNASVITGDKKPIGKHLEEIVPYIPVASELVVLNKFGLRTILSSLGLLRLVRSDFKLQLPVYTLYGVASAFFAKKYWLYLWEDAQQRVDELQQLQKAGRWYKKHNGRYAKSNVELTKTSFITSATNMYKEVKLDIFVFNHYINEAWLQGRLDAMESFPKDFNEESIGEIIIAANDPRVSIGEWQKWIYKFKAQYISFGCEVE